MNSQQELLEAINTISQNRDKSCDTPATVLRVEGDTVWVHIDGGADETPVQKTINCSEGETVQVRISNGSAFLVGNASAPPTDDATANVAHFIAEQADEKAEEAITSVNAIKQTVEDKVDSGDSNITDISSTMYQNAYGVNIYNDDLAVGDSYAHIDGDSFDIKQATTAGTIDDTNDVMLASFGANRTVIGRIDEEDGGYQLQLSPNGIYLVDETPAPVFTRSGWYITSNAISYYGTGVILSSEVELSPYRLFFSSPVSDTAETTTIGQNSAAFEKHNYSGGTHTKTSIKSDEIVIEDLGYYINIPKKTKLGLGNIYLSGPNLSQTTLPIIIEAGNLNGNIECFKVDWDGNVLIDGELQDLNGDNLLDEWVGTTTVSSGSFSFSGLNDDYTYSRPFIYVDDTSTNKNPTAQIDTISGTASNRTITWTTDADNGASVKIRRIK